GPLAAVAVLYWLPPYLLVKVGVRLATVTGDLQATVKILASAVFMVLWLAVTALWLGATVSWWLGLALLPIAPVLGRFSLGVVEEHLRLLREIRRFLRHITAEGLRAQLIAERDAIAAEFDALAR
ncbi:MAG: hypothetical protein AAFZ65_04750, partial [Planctomycetota bacterium]